MSVPVNQRSESKLEVCVKARELACYTLQITKNKKIFVEEYQDAITNKIIRVALDIHMCVWAANNILVNSKEDFATRHALQDKAALDCNILLSLIDIAKPLFHLDTKRVIYWGRNTVNVRNMIRAWRDSDRKRYTKHLGVG